MSGVPSCASTDWSRQTTIEWMMLCGMDQHLDLLRARSNSQRASMTSSALFIMVAESTEILRPMTQLGWAQAFVRRHVGERGRVARAKRPPDAVSTMWSMRACQVLRSSGRHWKMAECSLSMGSKVARPPPPHA